MDESIVHPTVDLLEAGQSMDGPVPSSNGHLDGSTASTVHLSVQQAAEQARLSTKTIRRMIRRGQLRAELVDGAYVIDPDALDQAVTVGSPGQSIDRPLSATTGRLDLSNVQALLEAATRPL